MPKGGGLVFLDSAAPAGGLGRYSLIGIDPWETITDSAHASPFEHPLDRLSSRLADHRHSAVGIPGPFHGGAIGFVSYDLGRRFERIPTTTTDDLSIPDLWFGLYDLFALFDHHLGKGWIVSTGNPERGSAAEARAASRLSLLRGLLLRGQDEVDTYRCGPLRSPHTRASYCEAVEHCLDWIAAGDVYQVNLSHRFEGTFSGSPESLYLRLRRTNPAPFAAYIDTGDFQVLSSSPERFLRIEQDRIETRPIKGTRPRGNTLEADRQLADELLSSEKDRAELTMIVDLLRNDLGRICDYGTVRTEALANLESYETVHHLVGVVTGRLRSGVGLPEVLRACFPGGSITGAPKIRAMEILEELERTRRGIYCGSIGYLSADRQADLNIAIRTLLVRDGRVYLQVGGGIVADSNPDAEYEETLHKAEGLFRAIELSSGEFHMTENDLRERASR